MHNAAIQGKYHSSQVLVDLAIAVDLENDNGETVLHHASLKGDVKLINKLIKVGADPTKSSNHNVKKTIKDSSKRILT